MLLSTGRVYCWGSPNAEGELGPELGPQGEGFVEDSGSPLDATGGLIDPDLAVDDPQNENGRVFAGGHTTCLIQNGGNTLCWGRGFLGVDPLAEKFRLLALSDQDPKVPPPIKNWLVCGLTLKDDFHCWGAGRDDTPIFQVNMTCSAQASTTQVAPEPATTIFGFVPRELAAGVYSVCARGDAGQVSCAGAPEPACMLPADCDLDQCTKFHCMSGDCPSISGCGDLADCDLTETNALAVYGERTCWLTADGLAVPCRGGPTGPELVANECPNLTYVAMTVGGASLCAASTDGLCCEVPLSAGAVVLPAISAQKLVGRADDILVLTKKGGVRAIRWTGDSFSADLVYPKP